MESIVNAVALLLRRLLKLALVLFVSLLALGMVLLALGAALLTVLWSLLTGRKPALFTTFTRFNQVSQQFRQGAWSRYGGAVPPGGNAAADVVDVQAHEVRDTSGSGRPADQG